MCSTRIPVSSLCSTSPCAACRMSSSDAALITSASSSAISHCVETGNGMPSKPFQLLQAIETGHTAAVLQQRRSSPPWFPSYFSGPMPSGSGAVNTSPHRLPAQTIELIHSVAAPAEPDRRLAPVSAVLFVDRLCLSDSRDKVHRRASSGEQRRLSWLRCVGGSAVGCLVHGRLGFSLLCFLPVDRLAEAPHWSSP